MILFWILRTPPRMASLLNPLADMSLFFLFFDCKPLASLSFSSSQSVSLSKDKINVFRKYIWHKRHDKQGSGPNKSQALDITIHELFHCSLLSPEASLRTWIFVFQIFLVLQYCHDNNLPGQFDIFNLDGDALGMVGVLEELFKEPHHGGLRQDLNNFSKNQTRNFLGWNFFNF